MGKSIVAIVRYEHPLESVRKAVELSHALDHVSSDAKVVIKPNIAYWTKAAPMPKWGMITTSRVVEDMVVLLKERGLDDITIACCAIPSLITLRGVPVSRSRTLRVMSTHDVAASARPGWISTDLTQLLALHVARRSPEEAFQTFIL